MFYIYDWRILPSFFTVSLCFTYRGDDLRRYACLSQAWDEVIVLYVAHQGSDD